MDESILITIREALGVPAEYDGFDTEIITAINNSLFSLTQLGVGVETGYSITGIDETWDGLFTGLTNIEAVKSYVKLKSRLEFDPPPTAHMLTAVKEQIKELEWRLFIFVDPDVVV